MSVGVGAATTFGAVAVVLLMVCAVPAAAAATPDLTPGPSHTIWAYGAVRTVNFGGHSGLAWVYQGSATYGYSVILNQTNTTSSTFELAVDRTMGARLSVEYCLPGCAYPTETATVDYAAWETTHAWANFSVDGSVTENGVAVPAISLLNSHSIVLGNLTDSASGPHRSAYLSAAVEGNAAVNFTGPGGLGLLPDDLTADSEWSSSSPFNATGSYAISYFYNRSGPAGSETVGPTSSSGSVNASGNVSVLGVAGPGSVDFGGIAFTNISLVVVGPFAVREGFILIPDGADLFGAGAATVGSDESGFTSVSMTAIYARPMSGGHMGIVGSEWLYSASTLNPSVTDLAPSGTEVAEIASGSDQVGSTQVQGTPISLAQANGDDSCLTSGGACPTGATGRTFGGIIGIAVIAIAVGTLAAVVVVAERRRLPPPAYPNAQLYPPGAAPAARPAAGARSRPPARPPEASEDDPLSNLW